MADYGKERKLILYNSCKIIITSNYLPLILEALYQTKYVSHGTSGKVVVCPQHCSITSINVQHYSITPNWWLIRCWKGKLISGIKIDSHTFKYSFIWQKWGCYSWKLRYLQCSIYSCVTFVSEYYLVISTIETKILTFAKKTSCWKNRKRNPDDILLGYRSRSVHFSSGRLGKLFCVCYKQVNKTRYLTFLFHIKLTVLLYAFYFVLLHLPNTFSQLAIRCLSIDDR